MKRTAQLGWRLLGVLLLAPAAALLLWRMIFDLIAQADGRMHFSLDDPAVTRWEGLRHFCIFAAIPCACLGILLMLVGRPRATAVVGTLLVSVLLFVLAVAWGVAHSE